jgi:cell division protein FtsB
MRGLLLVLLLLLGVVQYRLWFGEGSLAEKHRLELQVEEQTLINAQLRERNSELEREVLELQTGNEGLEQRAREQLGLIRKDETYYQVTDKQSLESAR